MNERVNPFKKLQKPGKHVKRIVTSGNRCCRAYSGRGIGSGCNLPDSGAGTGSIDNFRSAEGSGRNRTAF